MVENRSAATGRRLFSRTEIPMSITIGEEQFPVLNWSLGGLALPKTCPFSYSPTETINGTLNLLVSGVDLSVRVSLRFAHEYRERIGFAFVGLSPEQMGLLRTLLVRGGSSPLERAPLPAHPQEISAPPVRPRPLRTPNSRGRRRIARAMVVILVVAAFSSIGVYKILRHGANQAIEAAVVTPLQVATSADRGYIDTVYIKEGQSLEVGDPIISIRRRAEPAKSLIIKSPCACTVASILSRSGEEVATGQELVELSPLDTRAATVEMLVPIGANVTFGDEVRVAVEGSPAVSWGHITAISKKGENIAFSGLPLTLRNNPRFRQVIVSDFTVFPDVPPGTAVRVSLGNDVSWEDQLKMELTSLIERSERFIFPGDDTTRPKAS